MSRLSRLSATNRILTGSGLTPVATLTGPGVSPDALTAANFLDEAYNDLIFHDWKFNTLVDQTLEADGVTGEVSLPTGTQYVEFSDELEYSHRPVIRGDRVFDRVNDTYVFGKDLPVRKLVEDVPFEDAPLQFQLYVVKVAENNFVGTHLGEQGAVRHTQESLMMEFRKLNKYRVKIKNSPLMNVPSVLNRSPYPAGSRTSYMSSNVRRSR